MMRIFVRKEHDGRSAVRCWIILDGFSMAFYYDDTMLHAAQGTTVLQALESVSDQWDEIYSAP